MANIITGAENITAWAKTWFHNPNKDPDKVFTAGIPQAKFVYIEGGIIHAVEFPERSHLQHPAILQRLGIKVASILLAGTIWVPSEFNFEIQILTATPELASQVKTAIQINPNLPQELQDQFLPYWTNVSVQNDLNS